MDKSPESRMRDLFVKQEEILNELIGGYACDGDGIIVPDRLVGILDEGCDMLNRRRLWLKKCAK